MLISLLATSLRMSVVQSYFHWNQADIASSSCIEKDVEGSTCNGMCKLQEMLEETEAIPKHNTIIDSFFELNMEWFIEYTSFDTSWFEHKHSHMAYYRETGSDIGLYNLLDPPRV